MFFQMLTLAKLGASKGTKHYSQPLKVKVCDLGATELYTTQVGERREYAAVRIADTRGAMVYDHPKLKSMTSGITVILMNYISKHEEGTIVVTKNSKVLKTGEMEVPTETIASGSSCKSLS